MARVFREVLSPHVPHVVRPILSTLAFVGSVSVCGSRDLRPLLTSHKHSGESGALMTFDLEVDPGPLQELVQQLTMQTRRGLRWWHQDNNKSNKWLVEPNVVSSRSPVRRAMRQSQRNNHLLCECWGLPRKFSGKVKDLPSQKFTHLEILLNCHFGHDGRVDT